MSAEGIIPRGTKDEAARLLAVAEQIVAALRHASDQYRLAVERERNMPLMKRETYLRRISTLALRAEATARRFLKAAGEVGDVAKPVAVRASLPVGVQFPVTVRVATETDAPAMTESVPAEIDAPAMPGAESPDDSASRAGRGHAG